MGIGFDVSIFSMKELFVESKATVGDGRRIPVLVIAYKKPETTSLVIDGLRECAPAQVFVALNAPRETSEAEIAKCAAVSALLERIDWHCELKVLKRTEHLANAMSYLGACDWFFGQVEVGIVLDDDCVPAPDFFRLLAYLHANRSSFLDVGHVNGMNFFEHGDLPPSADAFFLTRYASCWGWASWQSEWQRFDQDLRNKISQAELWRVCDQANPDRIAARRTFWIVNSLRGTSLDREGLPPDWIWTLHLWASGRKIVCPATNLVRNVGIGNTNGVSLESRQTAKMKAGHRLSYFDRRMSKLTQQTGRLPEQIRCKPDAAVDLRFDRKMALIYGGVPMLQRWKFRLGEIIRRLRGNALSL